MRSGRPPLHTPTVLKILVEAAGEPVSITTLSRRVYGPKPPMHHQASIRCMVQRIREAHRDRLTVPRACDGAYRAVMKAAP